jgi:hypothetical protein
MDGVLGQQEIKSLQQIRGELVSRLGHSDRMLVKSVSLKKVKVGVNLYNDRLSV